MPSATDFYFDAAAQIDIDHWSQGRVVLLGDAAYCASPMSGQGTSLAIIGAYVLAGELAAASGLYQTAFAQFEQELRPFIKMNQALGLQSAKLMRSRENVNLVTWFVQMIMQIAPGRLIEFIINRSTRR